MVLSLKSETGTGEITSHCHPIGKLSIEIQSKTKRKHGKKQFREKPKRSEPSSWSVTKDLQGRQDTTEQRRNTRVDPDCGRIGGGGSNG